MIEKRGVFEVKGNEKLWIFVFKVINMVNILYHTITLLCFSHKMIKDIIYKQ